MEASLSLFILKPLKLGLSGSTLHYIREHARAERSFEVY